MSRNNNILRGMLRPAYNRFLRNRLPLKYAVMGGVVTRGVRLLDIQDSLPKYKEVNIAAIKKWVRYDDVVVEVGSGQGVCTVWAARMAPGGKIITFEGSEEMCNVTKDTMAVHSQTLTNNPEVEIHNEIIGPDVDVWGASEHVTRCSPSDLPDCDVLIMDCEGAELDILQNLSTTPRTCIIEAHPNKGVDPDDVVEELESRGHEIKSIQPDNHDNPFVYIIVGEEPDT